MGYFSVQPPVAIYERMKLHTEDVTVQSHWPFQGDLTDSVGSNDALPDNKFYQRVNGLDDTSDLLAVSTRGWNPVQTPGAPATTPDIKNLSAITVAAWVRVNAIPGANQAVIGMRGPGSGGSPNNYNFPWELGILTGSGNIRFFWQSGSKSYQGTNSLGVPLTNGLRRWHHLIGTRNSAQDTARLYMNGVLVDEATSLLAWDGGSLQNSVRFFNDDFGAVTSGQLLSAIVKNTYTDTVGAVALYEDAKEIVL